MWGSHYIDAIEIQEIIWKPHIQMITWNELVLDAIANSIFKTLPYLKSNHDPFAFM